MLARGVTRRLAALQQRRAANAAAARDVRVRFAPSPTGALHLGSLRTALFNWLFARAHGGAFILRIEDTDRQRLTPGCVEQFERVLDDYGLARDEGPSEGGGAGPYLQSQRTPLYHDAVQQLIEGGHAYRCFCAQERLDIIRRNAQQNRTNARYDGHCRGVSAAESRARVDEPHAVRFKFERRTVGFNDLCYGHMETSVDEGDFVILKSDKQPTYHLANVVDDHLMRVSHVIRGQEWLASTPKHIRLYEALGATPPVWLHLPLIMKDAKRKLSKRDENGYVDYYRYTKGYLPSALLNFLVRNGAGIRDFDPYHFYTLDDMIAHFDATRISTRHLQMDEFALRSYGRRSIRLATYEQLYEEIRRYLALHARDEAATLSDAYLRRALDFLLHNEEDFSHLAQLVKPDKGKDRFSFLFTRPREAIEPLAEFGRDGTRRILAQLLELADSDWTIGGLKQAAARVGVPYTHLFYLFRRAVINCDQGPPVLELVDFFGVAECRQRIAAQVQWLDELAEQRAS